MVAFSTRAALCTAIVVGGFGAAVTAHLPGGLYGLIGWQRDGLLPMDNGSPARAQDDRDIVTAVLRHEAGQVGRAAVCVRLADEGEALASERREIEALRRAVGDAVQAQRTALLDELERRRNPVRA